MDIESLPSCQLPFKKQILSPSWSEWASQLRKVSTAIKEQSPFIKHDFSVSPHTPEKKEMGLGVEKRYSGGE